VEKEKKYVSNWNATTVIDESVTKFGQSTFIHVQDADYLLQLTQVAPSPEDRDYSQQLPHLAFRFQLQDGPEGLGKTIQYIGQIAPMGGDGRGGSWALGRVVDALGFNVEQLKGQKFPTWKHLAGYAAALQKTMGGKKTGAELREGPYVTGRGETIMVSNITGFFPAEEWALRKPKDVAVPPPNGNLSPSATTSPSRGSAPAPTASTTPSAGSEGEFDVEALIAQMGFEPKA